MLTQGLMSEPYEALQFAAGVPDRLAGGVAQGFMPSEWGKAPRAASEYLGSNLYEGSHGEGALLPDWAPEKPHRGGKMFAPRGYADPERVDAAIIERERHLESAEKEINRLRGVAREETYPESTLARIAAFEDGIEQLQAELIQLERVREVTIPRRDYDDDQLMRSLGMPGQSVVSSEETE